MKLPNPYSNASLVIPDIHRVPTISYLDFLRLGPWGLIEYTRRFRDLCWEDYEWPGSFVSDVKDNVIISFADVAFITIAAVLFTAIRHELNESLFYPLAHWLETPSVFLHRVPENMFKILFYTTSTIAIFASLLATSHARYWHDPISIFEHWRPDLRVPWNIYALYIYQIGFYIHSIYGTLYLDSNRKDANIMLLHHFVTLALLGFSLGSKHHIEGLLVLMCHDVCDVFLEAWKLNSSLRRRAGGVYFAAHDAAATACFAGFAGSWALCRLYFFPLKVLYATLYGPVALGLTPIMPFYPLYALLLLALLAMNVYWFYLIVVGLINFFLGNLEEIDDTREYTPEQENSEAMRVNGFVKPRVISLVKPSAKAD